MEGINNGKEKRFEASKTALKNTIDGFFIDKKISLEVKESLLRSISDMVASFSEVRQDDEDKREAVLAMATENLESCVSHLRGISNYVEREYKQDPEDARLRSIITTLRSMIAGFGVSCINQSKNIQYEAQSNDIPDIQARAESLEFDSTLLKKQNMTMPRQLEPEVNPKFNPDPNRTPFDYDTPAQK